jgi:hypothetical protein
LALFEAVKRGVERALGNLKVILGDLIETLGDGIAVKRARGDDFKDQHVERTAMQVVFFSGHVV